MRYSLFSTAQCREGERAIRVYGGFSSISAAKNRATILSREDPSSNFLLCETDTWIPVADESVMADPVKREELIQHFAALSKKESEEKYERFEEHKRKSIQEGGIIENEKPLVPAEDWISVDMDDASEAASEASEEEVEEVVDGVGLQVSLPSNCVLANQRLCVVLFRIDKDNSSDFCVNILNFLDTLDDAKRYVCEISHKYLHDDIYTVDVCEWIWPISEHGKCDRQYRDERLNNLMHPKTASAQDIEEARKKGSEVIGQSKVQK